VPELVDTASEPGGPATDPAATDRAAADPGAADPAGGRRALRLARRERRRIMIACGFVVALCLALTLLIVWLAGSRATGTPSSAPVSAVVTGAVVTSVVVAPATITGDAR
jgi:hypothetical protein